MIRERVDPRAEVIALDSVVKGMVTGGSDVDVLVITERARELKSCCYHPTMMRRSYTNNVMSIRVPVDDRT
ncbi:hypothetical protein [Methanopyrus sp. SNP6]|uniref:hypothetical protein n=1 Tax=Methanopyrus sp. SNP6 TaxID=1937005 RepID=UPI0011E5D120|nr:hypothetical protein [Methanopyrus sp. SNP6]